MPFGAAHVPVLDRGHLLGDGVFETLRTHRGVLVQRREHAQRLAAGLPLLGLRASVARSAFTAVDALVARSVRELGPELNVRVQVTTGTGDALEGVPGRHAVTAIARVLDPAPPTPVRLVLASLRRPLGSPITRAKATSFLPNLVARREARAAGADDAVLLNEAGRVSEATTSNVVVVRGGRLLAPGGREGALEGTTRSAVLAFARRSGWRVADRCTLAALRAADEVLLLNSTSGVRASQRLGRRRLPGLDGPAYAALREGYLAWLDDHVRRAAAHRVSDPKPRSSRPL